MNQAFLRNLFQEGFFLFIMGKDYFIHPHQAALRVTLRVALRVTLRAALRGSLRAALRAALRVTLGTTEWCDCGLLPWICTGLYLPAE